MHRIKLKLWQLCLIFTSVYQQICALRLLNIDIPEVVDVRDVITLSCSYNMGNNTLNSVKWYKDKKEFFRYAPMMHPSFMTFPVVGVSLSTSPIDKKYNCHLTRCSVTLDKFSLKSNGAYRCEVSGDAPEFKLISQTSNMTVAVLPRHDPIINGMIASYSYGDLLISNCTSDMTSPPSSLSWYINDEKAPSEYLQQQQETTIDADGFKMRYRSLEIRFILDKSLFANAKGIIKLKCLAKIDAIPSATRESTALAYITTTDDLTNEKLINWRNSGGNVLRCSSVQIFAQIISVTISLLSILFNKHTLNVYSLSFLL